MVSTEKNSLPVALDLSASVPEIAARLIDCYSVSGAETPLADAIENALRRYDHLAVHRDGDTVVAVVGESHEDSVILAGHIDTVPLPTVTGALGTVPSSLQGGKLYGRGATDMKSGIAIKLALAAGLTAPNRQITYVFYDHEEVSAELNGLKRTAARHPEWFNGSFAILLEPTNGVVEGGCNGTLRIEIEVPGKSAHSARAWMGQNAIHETAIVLSRLAEYRPHTVTVDGLDYREGLNAVGIVGGVAGNVIPDRCVVTVNYRFAPDKDEQEAFEQVREVFPEYRLTVVDSAPGARPGLDHPVALAFVREVGGTPLPKYGWTDVAQFSRLGIPAVNYGPGDALLAHTDNEWVDVQQIDQMYQVLAKWLSS